MLEDGIDVALVGRGAAQPLAFQGNVARRGLFEAGDDAQRRRLAAAAWAQQ